jgi:hypothetical protein
LFFRCEIEEYYNRIGIPVDVADGRVYIKMNEIYPDHIRRVQ